MVTYIDIDMPTYSGCQDSQQLASLTTLMGHNTQHSGRTNQFFQNELMVEIYFKSLIRAIGKVLLMKFG